MRRGRTQSSTTMQSPIVFEPLERRLLLSGTLPSVLTADADNRGQVVLSISRELDAATVNTNSVQVFTAGPDQMLGTADDVLVDRTVAYDSITGIITIDANVQMDQRYRVMLDSTIITDTGGIRLDGEFVGADQVSGDGVEGGDFEMFTRPSMTLIAQFTTVAGIIEVHMFFDRAPTTVTNFVDIANSGAWDSTFIHRSITDFVIQGGGFQATTDLPVVPSVPPIINEPGISNTRGTIAMAKLSGNPNSATNEWFFNLADNSGNLDNQNSGFTVFGEILDPTSLAVMDALAAFETVNAGGQNGAFTDLPVIDKTVVDANGGVVDPSDVVLISRISILMEVSGTPDPTLDLASSVVVTSPFDGAEVRIFDLDGVGLPAASEMIRVSFRPGGRIGRIDLLRSFPANARVGIQISGASHIGAILDLRIGGAGELAFIVSDASITTIFMREAITGENLNGFVLPGVFLGADNDGDSSMTDKTAIYMPDQSVRSFINLGGLEGDVIASSMNVVLVRGVTLESDFALSSADAKTSFIMGRVIDSEIRTAGSIFTIAASEWIDLDARQETISASTIRVISIRGGRGTLSGGSFEADLSLTGVDRRGVSLSSFFARGGIFGSTWDISGNVRSIFIGADASSWQATIGGDVGVVRGGVMRNVSFEAGGMISTVLVRGWEGGTLTAQSMRVLRTYGGRGLTGSFEADLTLTGPAINAFQPVLSVFSVAGDLVGSNINITGNVRLVLVRGNISNVDMNINQGSTILFRANEILDSSILIDQGARFVLANRWIGGDLSGTTFDNIIVRNGMTADISANIVGKLFVVRGDYSGTINVLRLRKLEINGDLVDSVIKFNDNRPTGEAMMNVMIVRGEMRNTELHSFLDLGRIQLNTMTNSDIHVGFAVDQLGFPADGSSLQFNSGIQLLQIKGQRDGSPSMTNSFIVAGRIGSFAITNPASVNSGVPFGVSAGTIENSMVTFQGTTLLVSRAFRPTSVAEGDFEVRFDFAEPAPVV